MPISPDRYMTVEECAAVLRMTVAGFRRLCYHGTVPCSKIGRRYLIKTADFERWLADREADRGSSGPVELAGGRVHPAGSGGPASGGALLAAARPRFTDDDPLPGSMEYIRRRV